MIYVCLGGNGQGAFDPPRTRRRFQQIWQDVAFEEMSPLISATKAGRMKSVVDSNNKLTGETINLGPEVIRFSPLLISEIGPLNLNSFPDGYVFGNGGTGPKIVKLTAPKPGVKSITVSALISHMVFPYGTTLSDAQDLRLQEISEGIPPGSPERHTWIPDMIETPLPDTFIQSIPRPTKDPEFHRLSATQAEFEAEVAKRLEIPD